MAITFELPAAIEDHLRGICENFDAVAKEAALVELYRQGQLTHHQLASAFGLDRFATEELLQRHQVTEDLVTPAAFHSQLASLRKLVGE